MSENHRNVLFAIRYDLVKRFDDITRRTQYFALDEIWGTIVLKNGNIGSLVEGVFIDDD